jgi:hypothetical protein
LDGVADERSGNPNGDMDIVGEAGDLPYPLDAKPVLIGVEGDTGAAPALGKLESVLVLETLSGRLLGHARLPAEALVPAALVPLVPELFIACQGDMDASSLAARCGFFRSDRLGSESGITVFA